MKHIIASKVLKAMTPTIEKRILNGKYKQVITPKVEKDCIILDGYPILYTKKRWENLFKQYDISRIPGFDWLKFTSAEHHREQYIILVKHLDNMKTDDWTNLALSNMWTHSDEQSEYEDEVDYSDVVFDLRKILRSHPNEKVRVKAAELMGELFSGR